MLARSKETILCFFFFCSLHLSEAWLKLFLTWLALRNRSVHTRGPAPTFKCIMSRSLLSIRTLGKSLFIIHHYVLHMANSFLVWPTSFLCIQQNLKLTFSLKVLPSEGSGGGRVWGRAGQRRVHIKEKQPSVSTGSKQLVEEMQDVWTKTDKMQDDRKQISLPFYSSCKRRGWPSECRDVSQSPDAGSPLISSPLIFLSSFSHLPSSSSLLPLPHFFLSSLLFFLSSNLFPLLSLLSSLLLSQHSDGHLTVGLVLVCHDLLLEKFFSLLPRCLICSFAFLLRSTRTKNLSHVGTHRSKVAPLELSCYN